MVALVSVTLLLTAVVLLTLYIFVKILSRGKNNNNNNNKKVLIEAEVTNEVKAPGPKPWPVIGSLHLLGGHPTPFHAFTALASKYGPVYSIQLGSSGCVVVNNFALIKEVLITKGAHFGGRPDFIRFHQLFGGDRDNSLALCDWSDLQKTRRKIARVYCTPRFASEHYTHLDNVATSEAGELLQVVSNNLGGPFNIKPLIMATCANMFTSYMCSQRFAYNDPAFQKLVRRFDEIFWDINQGYAVDFMPWLLFAYKGHMRKLSRWAHQIRQFILARVIEKHRKSLQNGEEPKDFTDALLMHLENDPDLSWEHAIYELEDFIGGHSAVGNLIMLALAAVVKFPEVQKNIQMEVDRVTENSRSVTLMDKNVMPYTEATIWETLRITSSPIVPHVATQDTAVGGFSVEKGTVVFLNNYELNTGESYWKEPQCFQPQRFVVNGLVTKPSHFIPFSTGKRTCIGSRLVQAFSFTVLASILQKYDVTAGNSKIEIPKACVALPPDTFSLTFTPRTRFHASSKE